MIPRKRIDIGGADLASGLFGCFMPGDAARLAASIEGKWDIQANLACLSVRSGLDALLGALALPRGSEILISAVNIADMPRILEAHGLVPVPVDIDRQTLAVSVATLESARTPRTRAVLIAHLFGSRMPMQGISKFCNKNKYLLIEDCAQGYIGDGWRGEPLADARLFSFGPVKPATALGGAVLGFSDVALRNRVREHMARWPRQSRVAYGSRVLKYLLLAPFGNRHVFGALAGLCRLLGATHEALVAGAARGFAGGDFFGKIRRQPSAPLLRLLHRRMTQGVQASALRRIERSRQLQRLLGARGVGASASEHRHWIFPITHGQRNALISHLARHGFDAAVSASSLGVIGASAGRAPAIEATRIFDTLVYIPAHEGMTEQDIERLAIAVETFEQQPAPAAALKVP